MMTIHRRQLCERASLFLRKAFNNQHLKLVTLICTYVGLYAKVFADILVRVFGEGTE